MAAINASFHIQHTARPEHIEKILGAISDSEIFDSISLYEKLVKDNYLIQIGSGVSRSIDLCKKVGIIVQNKKNNYQLTSLGLACRKLALYRRDVFYDVMHYLLFATWKLRSETDYWSWTYGKTTELLWKACPVFENRNELFGQLYGEATRNFSSLEPVVGTETIGAVSNWIQHLTPSFFIFKNQKPTSSCPREWYSAELALLSISYLYLLKGTPVQTPVLLDKSTLEVLSPLCLAKPDRILYMIELASKTFSYLEIHSGEWGSSAILRHAVDITSFV